MSFRSFKKEKQNRRRDDHRECCIDGGHLATAPRYVSRIYPSTVFVADGMTCGLWLIASPFVFGYADAGTLRYWHVVLGIAVVLLAVLELRQDWELSDADLAHHSGRG